MLALVLVLSLVFTHLIFKFAVSLLIFRLFV